MGGAGEIILDTRSGMSHNETNNNERWEQMSSSNNDSRPWCRCEGDLSTYTIRMLSGADRSRTYLDHLCSDCARTTLGCDSWIDATNIISGAHYVNAVWA